MKYTIRTIDNMPVLHRYEEPSTRPIPTNAEFEFWCEIERLREQVGQQQELANHLRSQMQAHLFPLHHRPLLRGRYLLLSYEWLGCNDTKKPDFPEWNIRHWDGVNWELKKYTCDTGGMENCTHVAWCHLPTNNP